MLLSSSVGAMRHILKVIGKRRRTGSDYQIEGGQEGCWKTGERDTDGKYMLKKRTVSVRLHIGDDVANNALHNRPLAMIRR